MHDLLVWAMVSFSAAGLFCGAGALFAFGLNRWASVPKRYRLIMNAYAEGLRDAKGNKEGEGDG